VIGLVGGTVSAATREIGHWISWGITLALMMGMIGYMIYNARKYRWGSHCNKFGPTWLAVVAACLIMADLTRHVFQDINVWPPGPWPGSSQYRPNCEDEDMACLSVVGWLFTIVFTYTGFIMLFVATMWNAKICEKLREIRRKWAELRAEQDALVEETPEVPAGTA